MTETIQRAARAICINNYDDPDAPDTPYEIRGWRLYKSDATACIETLLDPSEEAEIAMFAALFPGRKTDGTYALHWREQLRKSIRAYHMSILGREE